MVDFTAITFRTADIIKIFKENQRYFSFHNNVHFFCIFLLIYSCAHRDAEEDCKIDNDSAVAIQRIYRGVLDRNKIYWKGYVVVSVLQFFYFIFWNYRYNILMNHYI